MCPWSSINALSCRWPSVGVDASGVPRQAEPLESSVPVPTGDHRNALFRRVEDVGRVGFLAGAAGFFTLVILMPDPCTVVDREVAEAVAGSFLGGCRRTWWMRWWRWGSAATTRRAA
jgi:hypothetical protein